MSQVKNVLVLLVFYNIYTGVHSDSLFSLLPTPASTTTTHTTHTTHSHHNTHSSNCVNNAVPLKIQNDGSVSHGNCTHMTKFVLCPVVDNTPLLSDVLYIGQLYDVLLSLLSISCFSTNAVLSTG